ncbi:ATP-dependent helicase [Butyrivibrio proteoclasticus]|uniref:ATP-dependent helicase n=1 Tax=Butyrivibrio proteoclasticus TaxID=43305 RepID=UPI00047B4D4B|nr:ATP-dependent helicase [Butyrivibrio proteoclasticus]
MRNNVPTGNDLLVNAAQAKAISHVSGPAMVLAGPGSGKTFVIVQRLINLITSCNIEPSSILVITFTKAAAIEMQQRFLKITDSSYPEVNFGTFHSVFYQIIRQSKSQSEKSPEIVNETFKIKLLRDILEDIKFRENLSSFEYDITDEAVKEIIQRIGKIKNTLEPDFEQVSNIPYKEYFKRIFDSYNKALIEYGKIDFDDMLLRCLKLLKENPIVLRKWQERFKFFLIDEYQDINPVQSAIIDLLCQGNMNLFVVGDDDQSIYGFRGSNPEIMLSFYERYSSFNPKRVELDVNYRCGKDILKAALCVIGDNKNRFKKSLHADDKSPSGLVSARRYKTNNDQIQDMVRVFKEDIENIGTYAVIFRTNQEAMNMAAVFRMMDIPTSLDEASRDIFSYDSVITIINYLKFATGHNEREIYLKIINKPMRFISRESARKDKVTEGDVLEYYRGNYRKQDDVKKFFHQLNMIAHMRPALSIRYIRREMGIDKLFSKDKDILDKVSEIAREYSDMEGFLKFIAEREKSDRSATRRRNGNCLKLLTMHGSKGLEFDNVWIPNLNEGIIPSRSAVEPPELEEERRILYVGMTRAKRKLFLSYLTGNSGNPMLPSRFLRPIRHLWENENYSPSTSPSSPS